MLDGTWVWPYCMMFCLGKCLCWNFEWLCKLGVLSVDCARMVIFALMSGVVFDFFVFVVCFLRL